MTKIEVNAKKSAEKTTAKAKKVTRIAVSSAATHSNVQRSTTLSRRYVRRPVAKKIKVEAAPAVKTTPKAEAKAVSKVKATKTKITVKAKAAAKTTPAKVAPAKTSAAKAAAAKAAKAKAEAKEARRIAKANEEILRRSRLAAKAEARRKALAQAEVQRKARLAAKAKAKATKSALRSEAKEKAMQSALRSVATMNEPDEMPKKFKKQRRGRRIFFALLCSAATVSALVAFVHFNMPDLSVRVAAMQTGIEATYPSFIPRNYSLANVTSDKEGEVVMYFNGPDGAGFSLSEEKSTWDSTALLNNYVKKNYPSDYTTMREQGITIYVRGDKACWVNGGLLYNIHATGKNLTKEQIRNIATSL